VEAVTGVRSTLAEGPLWDARTGEVVWVDIPAGVVHRVDPGAGTHTAAEVGQPVGAVVPRAAGGYVLAVRDGFAAFDPASPAPRLLAQVEADRPENRMNDGACDRAGRFWAGTMAEDERAGAGSLYRLDRVDGTDRVSRHLTGVAVSNGIGWSPDDRLMYYIDSPTLRVDVFDFDLADGVLSGRRPFALIPPGLGMPDGLAVDGDGCVWVALWGGWAVHRYTPDGKLDRSVPLPVARVSSCAFGGPGLDDLYITTARVGLTPAELRQQPEAGLLFHHPAGVPGQPAAAYAG
jgi:sugar lactone lactonase YvrE